MSENSGINGNSTNQGNNFNDTLLQMRTGLMTNISEIHFGDGRMDQIKLDNLLRHCFLSGIPVNSLAPLVFGSHSPTQ